MRRGSLALFTALFALFAPNPAFAFGHIVRQGETLAQIAARVYGDPKREVVLAAANALDSQGGSVIAPGMRMEIPAPSYHRVTAGETWAELALFWLGDPKRADVLARINQAVSWVPPVDGKEILIPYALTILAADGDRMDQIALRYLNDPNRAWELDAYNGRKASPLGTTVPLKRGDIVLVPLVDLQLTESGKKEARLGTDRQRGEGAGSILEAQRRADQELPLLLADVRGGRYVDAVTRGNRILGGGELTKTQLAILHRALLESYVALEASGAAAGACSAWRLVDPAFKLDPAAVSPKIRAACGSR